MMHNIKTLFAGANSEFYRVPNKQAFASLWGSDKRFTVKAKEAYHVNSMIIRRKIFMIG